MRWKILNGEDAFVVEWRDGEVFTPLISIKMKIMELVEKKQLVSCGAVGPVLEASLVDDVRAWGTIMNAIGYWGWSIIEAPVCPVDPEPTMDDN